MIEKKQITEVLNTVGHPETGEGLYDGGFVSAVNTAEGKVEVSLAFHRARDPFASSLRRQAEAALAEAFSGVDVSVVIEQAAPSPQKPAPDGIARVHNIVAIASGKGGVGKSSVAAYVAATLAAQGWRVGVLDADIYGPSQPQLFGVEGYLPPAVSEGGVEWIVPAESMGVKVMSIGFFVGERDAVVWRGPMAGGALKQLIHQTLWGELDFLLVDLPPGTGDVHLSVTGELKFSGAVIVSTPQRLAVSDVRRGVEMFRAEGINVPVWGIVENMAWFTPSELPYNRYYIFGRGGAREFALSEGIDFLGDIPIEQSVVDSGEKGLPSKGLQTAVKPYYEAITAKIVEKVGKHC
jgi:ATP-binding protein involved in chromosome partitioning